MPLKRTIDKAQRDKREGKSASTQAGEFVREEIDKIRHGEHGARSAKQAIATGFPRRDARASTCRRRREGGPASERARAPNTAMKPGRGSENPSAIRQDRARL
jgi:hypothetical protein